MFIWSPIPDQYAHLGSLEFAKLLIQETGVAVAPGVGFGEYGDQYVRLALVENEQRIRQAARNIKKFLSGNQSGQGNVIPLAAVGK
jgi:alanine-synthesizing transaminase